MNPTTNSDGEWRISIERWRAGDPDERGPMYCVYLVRSNGEWPRNARRVGDLWDEEAVELIESGGQKQAGVDDGDLVFEQPAPTIGKGRSIGKAPLPEIVLDESEAECPGCTDPRSEGTHSVGTKQHPAPQAATLAEGETGRIAEMRRMEHKKQIELKWSFRFRSQWRRNCLFATHHRVVWFIGPFWFGLTHKCNDHKCAFCNNWQRVGDSWQFDEQFLAESSVS